MSTPKFITFDCYGTLTFFDIPSVTRKFMADRLDPSQMDAFLTDFSAYRRDEVIGAWKPYDQVLNDALARTCELWNVVFKPEDARTLYDAVPSWGPHPDVPEPLAAVAKEFPLVIFSNASDDQIMHNVEKLGAPFHAVFTAQQAGAYKPRLRAFEFMFDQLGCAPEDVAHVSSSLRYDLIPACDLRIPRRIYVNRGYEPSNRYYATDEVSDLGGLPAALGLQPPYPSSASF